MKNGRIGIVVALEAELHEMRNIMKNTVQKQIYDVFFIEGTIAKKKCVVAKSEVGKVNAARTTQIMVDKYSPDYIINLGVAAGTNDNLEVGDVIIGKRVVQHDFDITAFGHNKGYIGNVGNLIKSNEQLVSSFEEILKPLQDEKNYTIKTGITATGDIFCTESTMKNKIYAKFDADVIDMEGAGVAQVCYLDNIPFVALKCVFDTPYGTGVKTYNENTGFASKRCVELLEHVLTNIE